MQRLRSLSIAFLLLTTSIGCGEDAKTPVAPPPTLASTDGPGAHVDLKSLIISPRPQLPPAFEGLVMGMTLEEAKAAKPDLSPKGELRLAGFDFPFFANFDRQTGRLVKLSFSLPREKAEALCTEAWGEPVRGKGILEKKRLFWFNAEAHLRAVLDEGFGDAMHLEFTAYLPARELIGQGEDNPGFGFEQAQPLLGSDLATLEKAYAAALVRAASQDVEAFRRMPGTGKIVSRATTVLTSIYLDLPPTEYEASSTRVHLSFDESGKVRRYRFGLAYRARPEAKEDLLGLVSGKLGQPQSEQRFGRVLHQYAVNPRVEAEEDPIGQRWDLTVEKTN